MNDYKELIEELRNGYVLHENYNGEPEIIHRPSPTDKEAAAAIEQLVKERDALLRDALLADGKIKNDCRTCANNTSAEACQNSIRAKGDDCWEWRGVQE